MGPLVKSPFRKSLLGPRIQLVEATPDHAELLWQSILKDRLGRNGDSWRWLTSADELKDYLAKNSCDNPNKEVVYLFQKDKTIFGSFHVHTLCYSDYKTEIGYAIEKNFEGHGYVVEAVKLIEEELKRLGFNKIIINCDVENARSVRVAERAGFLLEGTLRQDCIENGKFRDSALFGKLL